MLEAMSCRCVVVGSDTEPVKEVVRDGENGLLVDFFSPEGIVEKVDRVLDHPDRMADIRENARKTIVKQYDRQTRCLPEQVEFVKSNVG